MHPLCPRLSLTRDRRVQTLRPRIILLRTNNRDDQSARFRIVGRSKQPGEIGLQSSQYVSLAPLIADFFNGIDPKRSLRCGDQQKMQREQYFAWSPICKRYPSAYLSRNSLIIFLFVGCLVSSLKSSHELKQPARKDLIRGAADAVILLNPARPPNMSAVRSLSEGKRIEQAALNKPGL